MTKKIIIPLPSSDFDPTEVAVSWKILHGGGCTVVFATPDGKPGEADEIMLSGEGLDPWGFIPGLRKIKLMGLMLRANSHGRRAYAEMIQDPGFQRPLKYTDLAPEDFDGLLCPGGHAPGMRDYLEDEILQRFIVNFFEARNEEGRHKPVAAVCHGVVLLARCRYENGRSVLHGHKTTALTWKLEQSAWRLSRFYARPWDAGYYRTYMEKRGEPEGYASVEEEVKRALTSADDFLDVPTAHENHWRKTSGLIRDRKDDDRAAWIVQSGDYLSARWPGDVHTFAKRYLKMLGN